MSRSNPSHHAPQRPPTGTPLETIAIVAAFLRAYAAGRPVPAPIAAVLARHLEDALGELAARNPQPGNSHRPRKRA